MKNQAQIEISQGNFRKAITLLEPQIPTSDIHTLELLSTAYIGNQQYLEASLIHINDRTNSLTIKLNGALSLFALNKNKLAGFAIKHCHTLFPNQLKQIRNLISNTGKIQDSETNNYWNTIQSQWKSIPNAINDIIFHQ